MLSLSCLPMAALGFLYFTCATKLSIKIYDVS